MKLFHLFKTRPHLGLSVLIGWCVFFVAGFFTLTQAPLTRALLAWDAASWFYVLSLWSLMLRAPVERIRHIARVQDQSATAVLTLVCVAACMSFLSIFLELATARHYQGGMQWLHYGLTLATLLGTWFLVPTAFAMHYAHLFYGAKPDAKPLNFPEPLDEPDYLDFLYFSFTLALTSQTSDIAIASRAVRRVALLQSILSFFFNIAVLGLSINIGASLVSN